MVSPLWLMATTSVCSSPIGFGVAVLAGDLDLDGYPGELLYGVLAEQSGVVGRAAGDHDHPVYLREVEVHLGEIDGAVGVDAAEEGRAESGGLLVDLLEHVVLVAAELYGLGIPVHLEALALDALALGG